MRARDSDVVIRHFREDDTLAVGSLYTEVFGEVARQVFSHRWNWQFFGNPTSDYVESLIWVAESGQNVVGFLASFCVRFKVLDNQIVIRLPCDLMVSAKARGKGVGEKLIRAYIASEDLIANAFGYTPAAGRMYSRLGYQEVNAERLRMRPINAGPIIRDALRMDSKPRAIITLAPLIWRDLGGVLTVGLRAINRAMMPGRSPEFDVRQCTVADVGFDELWRRVSPAIPIAAVRDRRWVQWRFLDDPSFKHRLFCAYDYNGELAGYIDVRVSTRRGLRFGRILDLFCDPRTPGLAQSLLVAGVRCLEAEGADVVTCLGHLPQLQQVIAKYCYLTPKRLQKPAMLLWKGDARLREEVYDADRWHLTHADGDDGFSP